MSRRSRRCFLSDVGRGMLVAGLGSTAATELGLANAAAFDGKSRLNFGTLEPLVNALQETPPDRVIPLAVERLQSGSSLESIVAAAALANARAFGGHDYTGFHTFMALLPAFQMAGELPTERRALPVLKVIHRNSRRIHDQEADDHDALPPLTETAPAGDPEGMALRGSIRAREQSEAEARLAALCRESPEAAFSALQPAVEDDVNVHRVVLAWRAWAMLDLAGQEYAETLLRQSVRFCVDSENYLHDHNRQPPAIRDVLPRLLEEHRLLEGRLGTRVAEDGWVEELARQVGFGGRDEAAAAVAAALQEGFDPESVGEAISLAANLLVLHDPGRKPEYSSPEKPPGCVHGDSTGVHASDAANAWRSIARVSNPRNRAASLVVAAYHTAGQSTGMETGEYRYLPSVSDVKTDDQSVLLGELRTAIEGGDQSRACAVTHCYGDAGHSPRPLQDLLLGYAISEDGALHAEKYYRTATEEFAATRPAFQWRQLVALARVTASEYGHPAPGYDSACELLGIT
ncbi:MAG: hypothetical protein KDA75_12290 [Planctomycetaceae bacterium]|nr:hypothetical protein [Planctomycetaceae bacterium]